MKKKLFIAAICAAGLVSCDLEQIPENQVTFNNAFKSENELNATTSSILFFENAFLGKTMPSSQQVPRLTISVGTMNYVIGTHAMPKTKMVSGLVSTTLSMSQTYSLTTLARQKVCRKNAIISTKDKPTLPWDFPIFSWHNDTATA